MFKKLVLKKTGTITFILLISLVFLLSACGESDSKGNKDQTIWYLDADGDGYGDPNSSVMADSQPAGYVADNTDNDDTDATVHSSNPTIANGDFALEKIEVDADGDGTPDFIDREITYENGLIKSIYYESGGLSGAGVTIYYTGTDTFTYNSEKKITNSYTTVESINTTTNRTTQSINYQYTYNSDGTAKNIMAQGTTTNETDSYDEVSAQWSTNTESYQLSLSQTMEYTGGKLVRVTDLQTNDHLQSTNKSVTDYTYDSNGRCTEEKEQYDLDNDGVYDHNYITTYSYNANGDILETEAYNDNDGDGVFEYSEHETYEYSNDEKLIKKTEEVDYNYDGIADSVSVSSGYRAVNLASYHFLKHPQSPFVLCGNAYPFSFLLQKLLSLGYNWDYQRNEMDHDNDGVIDEVEINVYDSNDLLIREEYDYDNNGTPDEVYYYSYTQI